MLIASGMKTIPFLTNTRIFVPFLVITDMWKNIGFGSIIYLAAIAGIDVTLYESAEIDGAGHFAKIWHITLPGIAMAISVNLILSLSGVLNGGFDQIFNLDPTGTVFDIIDTYLYRIAFAEGSNYAVATALGLFKSVIGLALILLTDKAAKKVSGVGIW
jgi:putative aldouronate transport system permease protein